MLVVCWAVKGGVGTSVTAAGLALATASAGPDPGALVVDVGGDQPALFGAAGPGGLGLAEWLHAGVDVPGDALSRLEISAAPGVGIVPRGHGPLPSERSPALEEQLAAEARPVVVDLATDAGTELGRGLIEAADRSYLVVRACPLALPGLAELPAEPTGVIVVRHRRRTVRWQDIADASGAPVVAEPEIDPAVAAAVDAGLAARSLPRRFLRVLGDLR